MARARRGLRLRLARQLDSALASMLVFTLAFFTLFLLAPLAAVVFKPLAGSGYSFLDLFRDPSMVRLRNVEPSPFFVARTAGYLVVNVKGPRYGVIVNSLVIASAVTALATLAGVVVAFTLARYEFRGRTLLRILALVPMLYTPFINAYVVSKVFRLNGLISYALNELGFKVKLNIGGMAGVILAQTMMFWPIVYLNTYASMVQVDPSLEEQAENLGARGFTLFRKVTLPLSLPGIAAGAALVFVFSLEDLAAPLAFNFYDVVSYRVFNGVRSAPSGEVLPETGALALLLLLLAMAAFLGIRRYVTLRQYAMLSRGGAWRPRVRRLGWRGRLAVYLLILPWILFSATPQIGTVVYTFSERWIGPLPEGVTLEHVAHALSDDIVLTGLRNSLTYAAAALTVILALGFSSAYLVARLRLPGLSLLDALATSPIAVPGLALATGYLLFFSSGPFREGALARVFNPFYAGPALLFILAYTVRKSPFTTRAVFAGLQQTHEALEEAAFNLGAGRWTVLRRIVAPLISLNILSGLLVSLAYILTEVSVSVTLGGIREGQQPLTYVMYDYLYGKVSVEGPHLVASMALLLMTVQLAVVAVVTLVFKQRYAFIGL
ncbi:ABC transporter permease [Stetteria hydrogenophila]